MYRKEHVILGDNGELIGVYKPNEVPDLLPNQRLIIHSQPNTLGYRLDKIMDETNRLLVKNEMIGSQLAAALMLQVMQDKLIAGRDEKGCYVLIDNKKFYENYWTEDKMGKGLITDAIANTKYQTRIAFGGIRFVVNVLTVCYLLFHNHDNLNPFQKSFYAMPIDEEKSITPDNVGLVFTENWNTRTRTLVNSLLTRKLLLPGNVSYYTLASDEDLGLIAPFKSEGGALNGTE
jgi:hypothetical protein